MEKKPAPETDSSSFDPGAERLAALRDRQGFLARYLSSLVPEIAGILELARPGELISRDGRSAMHQQAADPGFLGFSLELWGATSGSTGTWQPAGFYLFFKSTVKSKCSSLVTIQSRVGQCDMPASVRRQAGVFETEWAGSNPLGGALGREDLPLAPMPTLD